MKVFNLIFLLTFSLLSLKVNADSISAEASAVSILRQEVEMLSNEIEVQKKLNQSQLDVYIQREQEISAQILREKFKAEQIKSQIQLSKEKIAQNQVRVSGKNNQDWLNQFWVKLNTSYESANPIFSQKFKERLAKLRFDLKEKKITYEHALLQTWFLLDEDLRKSQDSEYVIAPLNLNNEILNVELIRLGRSRGYFRTAQGKYGHMDYENGWKISYFNDKKSIEKINTLLSQYKKQQKTGLYELPGMKL